MKTREDAEQPAGPGSGLRDAGDGTYHESRMHRSDWIPRTSWTLVAFVWLAAGPLALPLVGAIRCRHDHAMMPGAGAGMTHQGAAPHSQSPCYCDQMTGAMDGVLAPTIALPTVFPSAPGVMLHQESARLLPVSRPASHVLTPTPRPPIAQV